MATWKIPFPSIGDPYVSIVDELYARGIGKVYVDQHMGSFINKSWMRQAEVAKKTQKIQARYERDPHPVGVLQPAIFALDKNYKVLYRWISEPSWKNIGGAHNRPDADIVWKAVQTSLKGDMSLMEGKDVDKIGFGGPNVFFPLFYLALLANGRWIAPRGFGVPPNGKRGTWEAYQQYGNIPIAMAQGVSAVCALAAAGLYYPIPIITGTLAYSAYVRYVLVSTYIYIYIYPVKIIFSNIYMYIFTYNTHRVMRWMPCGKYLHHLEEQ